MSSTKAKKSLFKPIAICLLAACVVGVCIASFFAFRPLDKTTYDEKTLNETVENTKTKLEDFEISSSRIKGDFADSMFKKAIAAAEQIPDKNADLKKAAESTGVSSILLTDDKGVIIASYPDDLNGKSLTDDKNTAPINAVAKGIVPKALGEADENKDDTYTVYAGAKRTGEEPGAVAVGIVTDEYAKAQGYTLADECSCNVIIENDNGKRLSSSFKNAKNKTIADLDKKNDGKAFEINFGGNKVYEAKTISTEEYTALVAIPVKTIAGNAAAFWIIIGADVVLFAVGIMIILRAGKSKKDE